MHSGGWDFNSQTGVSDWHRNSNKHTTKGHLVCLCFLIHIYPRRILKKMLISCDVQNFNGLLSRLQQTFLTHKVKAECWTPEFKHKCSQENIYLQHRRQVTLYTHFKHTNYNKCFQAAFLTATSNTLEISSGVSYVVSRLLADAFFFFLHPQSERPHNWSSWHWYAAKEAATNFR